MTYSVFMKTFEARIKAWSQTLDQIQVVLDKWRVCQREWLYLQPIFSSEDIIRQMPTEGKTFVTMYAPSPPQKKTPRWQLEPFCRGDVFFSSFVCVCMCVHVCVCLCVWCVCVVCGGSYTRGCRRTVLFTLNALTSLCPATFTLAPITGYPSGIACGART